MCLPELLELAESGKQCTLRSELETIMNQVRSEKALVTQLQNSLAKTVHEVKALGRRKKAADKQREDGVASKAAVAERKQASQQESSEKKRLQTVKVTAAFRMDFTTASVVTTYANLDELARARESADWDYSEPFLVQPLKAVADMMDDASNKLKTTLDIWETAYPDTTIASTDDMVHAPLMQAHGLRELDGILKSLLPAKDRVTSALPRLSKHDGQLDLYGYTKVCVVSDFEKDYLAAMRLNIIGYARVLTVPLSAVVRKINAAKKRLQFGSCARVLDQP